MARGLIATRSRGPSSRLHGVTCLPIHRSPRKPTKAQRCPRAGSDNAALTAARGWQTLCCFRAGHRCWTFEAVADTAGSPTSIRRSECRAALPVRSAREFPVDGAIVAELQQAGKWNSPATLGVYICCEAAARRPTVRRRFQSSSSSSSS